MTTSTSPSLLDWIMKLLGDPDARAQFTSDPDGYASRYGFPNLSSGDVHDALCLAADCAPAHADKEFHLPSPSRDHDHDDDHHGGGSHYLKHYINNYETVVHRETIIDNSVHQKIDTDGGDFDQHLDMDPVVASGDGAVATHGDILGSTITPGNGNVIGENLHAVTGDDNTTAFGTGAANTADLGDSKFGDGGSLSIGGNALGSSTESDTRTDVRNSGDGATSVNAAGPDGHANSYADQHEADTSQHSSYEDASREDSHDSLNSHNDSQYDDSHNYQSHIH
ncbi:MAG TPA: IniB N-terminal domain-containing protein [Pseudonocardia sp.]|uniref:IniB N-terminal domain-containing protein n=1 Tax=Pseudonocardia sp. TaxID=60912 RepID=UPI002C134980|nr:IniB N-terminal domain-containing protein [Pseudonocardia sp.]HTF50324.1 IniB N-terminal domain-containing protein [Pseudonocardia sp.]